MPVNGIIGCGFGMHRGIRKDRIKENVRKDQAI